MECLFSKLENFQGTDVSYRGVVDDIKMIVLNISTGLPKNSNYINSFYINDYSLYPCIKGIHIDGNNCFIKYVDNDNEVIVSFSSIFFDNEYSTKVFNYDQLISMGYSEKEAIAYKNKYIYSSRCHDVTLKKLIDDSNNSNICAVTSLCINNNNVLFYHSYIWDKCSDMIYDYARNICMSKDVFDLLFVYKEINILNYDDFCAFSKCYSSGKYYPLYYFALVTLLNEQYNGNVDSLISGNSLDKKLVC